MAMKEGFELDEAALNELGLNTLFSYGMKRLGQAMKGTLPTKKSPEIHAKNMERASDKLSGLKNVQKPTPKDNVSSLPVKKHGAANDPVIKEGEVKARNKMKKNRMDTARGDLYNKRNKLNIGPGDTGHATRQQSMKALGRALRNEAAYKVPHNYAALMQKKKRQQKKDDADKGNK
jgi:hypothetical protein